MISAVFVSLYEFVFSQFHVFLPKMILRYVIGRFLTESSLKRHCEVVKFKQSNKSMNADFEWKFVEHRKKRFSTCIYVLSEIDLLWMIHVRISQLSQRLI